MRKPADEPVVVVVSHDKEVLAAVVDFVEAEGPVVLEVKRDEELCEAV